ncbi:MAG: hypothetical protein GW946_02555 [Candidatus Pacebacteria bacterium]|nr:hypothetical protein [Candidatus Paceibacterota bacterium]PIR60510.1 MAG: hypothetical protein COU67_01920 [Candidatus Pacebacteria bacterium CG10_big_fil_rev_8_21_14_0_10_44_54]
MGKVQDHKRTAKGRRQVDPTQQKAAASDRFEVEGEVSRCLPNTMFYVEIKQSQYPQMIGRTLLGTLVGKMRLFRIRVLPGDVVKGYVSKYDLKKMKITFRSTQKEPQSI